MRRKVEQEFRLYVRNARGFSYEGTSDERTVMFCLEVLVRENPDVEYIVVRHDNLREQDEVYIANLKGDTRHYQFKEEEVEELKSIKTKKR